MQDSELDLRLSPDTERAAKVFEVSNSLFDAVKAAPLDARSGFPRVLRNNNFAVLVRFTAKYVFVEVVGKAEAKRRRPEDTAKLYRRLFVPLGSSKEGCTFALNDSRLVRFAGGTFAGGVPFGLGENSSFCAWDFVVRGRPEDKGGQTTIDLIYVVSFGSKLGANDAPQEIDSIVRLTVAEWSRGQ